MVTGSNAEDRRMLMIDSGFSAFHEFSGKRLGGTTFDDRVNSCGPAGE